MSVCVKFEHRVCGGVDVVNGCRTHSLHLRFVTIAFISFENANVDVDAKCEWALRVLELTEWK